MVLINNPWKKKTAVIVVAVFILTLLALDLSALLPQGKVDVLQAQAALPFSYYLGHAVYINGRVYCPCCGGTCAVIVMKNREIIIPLIPLK